MKTTNICKAKPNETKAGSGHLLRHPARKWIEPIQQLAGPARSHCKCINQTAEYSQ